jgi:hypothetical protein
MSTTAYDPTPDPAFARDVTRFPWVAWVQSGVQIGWVASGECPHCGHLIAVYRRRVRGVRPTSTISATCNCVQPHGGRPEGVKQGCGQSAVLDLSEWSAPTRSDESQ